MREGERMPDLTVVSERSKKEIKQQEASRVLKSALINLAANLMRVVRGAGNPNLITQHVEDFTEAYIFWEDAYKRLPDESVFQELLKFPEPDLGLSEGHLEAAMLEHTICSEALQIVASTLLGQRVQRDKASADLHRSIRHELVRRARLEKERRVAQKSIAGKPEHGDRPRGQPPKWLP
jgi:hypothetical protein